MLVHSFHCNPFQLSTACHQWSQKDRSCFQRLLGTVKGVVYDLWVKNPYQLIVENGRELKKNYSTLTRKEVLTASSLILLGINYASALYGLSLYALGKSTFYLGLKMCSPLLQSLAMKIAQVGKGLFIFGCLPSYFLCYAIPHWMIQKVSCASHTMVHFVRQVALWIFCHVIKPFHQYCLSPIARVLSPCFHRFKVVMDCAVSSLTQHVKSVWMKIWVTIFKPFWTKVLAPLCQGISHCFHWTVQTAHALINHLWKGICFCAQWIFDHFLAPIFRLFKHHPRYA
jgi:hypothetical protein